MRDTLKRKRALADLATVGLLELDRRTWPALRGLQRQPRAHRPELARIAVPLANGPNGPAGTPGLVARRRVVELYPAGGARYVRLPHRGYQPPRGAQPQFARGHRTAILAQFEHEVGTRLTLDAGAREACVRRALRPNTACSP